METEYPDANDAVKKPYKLCNVMFIYDECKIR